jgi:hypothetical protein
MHWTLKGSAGSLTDSIDYCIYFLFIVNLALKKFVGYLKILSEIRKEEKQEKCISKGRKKE